jgi:hypothetical protein
VHAATCATPSPRVFYKWEEGTNVKDYASAAHAWLKYTEEVNFCNAFRDITANASITNDERAAKVESFLLT